MLLLTLLKMIMSCYKKTVHGDNGDDDDDNDDEGHLPSCWYLCMMMMKMMMMVMMVTMMVMMMMMEDTYLPAGICAGCAGDMNSFQGGGSSCNRELFEG